MIFLPYIHSQDQLADILTEASTRDYHRLLTSNCYWLIHQHQFQGECKGINQNMSSEYVKEPIQYIS